MRVGTTMTHHESPNPFESHINSDAFDVSSLAHRSQTSVRVRELMQSIVLDERLVETYLDEDQRTLCHELTIELLHSVIRDRYNEELHHLSDDNIRELLTVPLVVGMLAQQQLVATKPAPAKTTPTQPERTERLLQPWTQDQTLQHRNTPLPWRELLQMAWERTRSFFDRLFRRY